MTVLRWAPVVIAIAGGALLLLRAAEQRLLYPAPPRPGGDVALETAAERVWLDGPGTRSEALLLSSTAENKAPRLVIYAHGNGELIDSWVDQFEPLRTAGVSV